MFVPRQFCLQESEWETQDLEVIRDPGEGGTSEARILWDGEAVIATVEWQC